MWANKCQQEGAGDYKKMYGQTNRQKKIENNKKKNLACHEIQSLKEILNVTVCIIGNLTQGEEKILPVYHAWPALTWGAGSLVVVSLQVAIQEEKGGWWENQLLQSGTIKIKKGKQKNKADISNSVLLKLSLCT